MPKRSLYLWVCTNVRPEDHPLGSCGAKGSQRMLEQLKQAIADAGLKKRMRACGSTCLDLCWVGPAAAVSGQTLSAAQQPICIGKLNIENPKEFIAELAESLDSDDPHALERVLAAYQLNPNDFDRPKP